MPTLSAEKDKVCNQSFARSIPSVSPHCRTSPSGNRFAKSEAAEERSPPSDIALISSQFRCDLALPSCTQCLRKNRMCFGYRNEQDMVFRNETGLVISKVRKSGDGEERSLQNENAFATLDLSTLVQHPSRRATLQDEAMMYWLANFNEKFFSSSSELPMGFEYLLPVYRDDLARGGPTVEIIKACGLASLGNSKGAPDLLRAARVMQLKVLGQLNEQLQNPEHALSDSSVLTCLLLSSFENMVCDGAQSMTASQTHLRGAATIVKLRGSSQFASLVGHGMFVRLRGSILSLCLLTSEEFPEFFLEHIEDERLTEYDFEFVFFSLMSRVCKLRTQQKRTGYVDGAMVAEARATLQGFQDWDPEFPQWILPHGHRSWKKRPGTSPGMQTFGADKAHRFIWVAMSWLLMHSGQILLYELLLVYFRAQEAIAPTPDSHKALQDAITAQTDLARDIQDAVDYHLENMVKSTATTRSIGAHMLMMPLSILLGASSTNVETFKWIAKTASRIAEVFGLKQGKMVADFLMMGIKAETFALSPTQQPQTQTPTVFSDEGASDEGMWSRSASLSTPASSPSPSEFKILIT
ncbi:hypothetical protein BU23DRAFT_240234 [Bimuria novae-zelandiae CBS 107.79]|uniref:Zn(2)-C6 fungal-type domain-containing protein n=1 Tax=Bimuria novae-zelandiae CBS 107.79 TaxID=1447943 RepID=A0A6A5UZK8_9PLEO|nr:hypothetical protein BU23DRAFT_240234 [Bimuria novae-zelandiae CBS 107.79]